jgi:hypothetical protein
MSNSLLGLTASLREGATLTVWLPLGLRSISSLLTQLPLRMGVADDLGTMSFRTISTEPGADRTSTSLAAAALALDVEARFSGVADVEVDLGFLFGVHQRVVEFEANLQLTGHVELSLELRDFVVEDPALLNPDHFAATPSAIDAKLSLSVDEAGVDLRAITSDSCEIVGVNFCEPLGKKEKEKRKRNSQHVPVSSFDRRVSFDSDTVCTRAGSYMRPMVGREVAVMVRSGEVEPLVQAFEPFLEEQVWVC